MSGYIGSKSSVTLVDGYNQTEADAVFLTKTGDTMTGPLSVTGTVTATTLQTTAGGTVTTASGNDLNIVYPASRSLFIKEGSETHVTVNNVGSVGIGTGSPSFPLSVQSNSSAEGLLILGRSSDDIGEIAFRENDNSTALGELQYRQDHAILRHRVGDLRFATGGTSERMRLDASGNVLVNTLAQQQSCKLSIKTNTDGFGIGIDAHKSQNSNYYFMKFGVNTNTTVGSIYSNGSSTTYATSSDYRLKENTVSLTGASERVNQLLPKRFNFINDETSTLVDGFLAHEVQAVVPEAILGTHDGMMDEEYEVTAAIEATYDDDGNELTAAVDAVMGTRNVPDYQGIDQSKLVPLLTAALQEALNKIDTMETRLAALEAV